MIQKFEGLIAAPFAPMDEKGAVVLEKIAPYYYFLKRNNVKGAFINGSTGEGVSLTQKERQKIAEKWVEAAKENPSVKIINLVGGTSYAECIENAQYSAEIGADAIALLAPYYFKPSGAKALAEFCARVAESVPQTPLYFYHIPVLSGCFVPMYDFLQEAAPVIPNLVGIKYTHEDFMDFLSCLRFMDEKYEMLWGRDENLLSALVLGATGGVGSTYNYASPLYYQLIDAFNKGDLVLARELQQKSIDMIRLLGKYGGIATGKAFMKYIGFDCGGFRLPIKNKWLAKYDEFKEEVRALKMENLFSTL
jgi:N-acetylneuraminate lyase